MIIITCLYVFVTAAILSFVPALFTSLPAFGLASFIGVLALRLVHLPIASRKDAYLPGVSGLARVLPDASLKFFLKHLFWCLGSLGFAWVLVGVVTFLSEFDVMNDRDMDLFEAVSGAIISLMMGALIMGVLMGRKIDNDNRSRRVREARKEEGVQLLRDNISDLRKALRKKQAELERETGDLNRWLCALQDESWERGFAAFRSRIKLLAELHFRFQLGKGKGNQAYHDLFEEFLLQTRIDARFANREWIQWSEDGIEIREVVEDAKLLLGNQAKEVVKDIVTAFFIPSTREELIAVPDDVNRMREAMAYILEREFQMTAMKELLKAEAQAEAKAKRLTTGPSSSSAMHGNERA